LGTVFSSSRTSEQHTRSNAAQPTPWIRLAPVPTSPLEAATSPIATTPASTPRLKHQQRYHTEGEGGSVHIATPLNTGSVGSLSLSSSPHDFRCVRKAAPPPRFNSVQPTAASSLGAFDRRWDSFTFDSRWDSLTPRTPSDAGLEPLARGVDGRHLLGGERAERLGDQVRVRGDHRLPRGRLHHFRGVKVNEVD